MKRLFTHLVHQGFSWQFPSYILFSWQSKWTSTWALKQFMKKPGPVKSLPVQLPRWPKWMKGAVAPTLKKPNKDPLGRKSFSQIWQKKELILQMLGFAMKMFGKNKAYFPFHGDWTMVMNLMGSRSVKTSPLKNPSEKNIPPAVPRRRHIPQSSIPWKSLATIFLQVGLRVSPFLKWWLTYVDFRLVKLSFIPKSWW